jgi:hypothetical protein
MYMLFFDDALVGLVLGVPFVLLIPDYHGAASTLVQTLILLNVTGIALAPAAVLTGAGALLRIWRAPTRHGGKGLAAGGLLLGVVHCAICILVIVSLVGRRAGPGVGEPEARGAMRAVFRAEMEYAQSNGGRFGTLICLQAPKRCLPDYGGPAFLDSAVLADDHGYLLTFYAGRESMIFDRPRAVDPRLTEFAMVFAPRERKSSVRSLCADSTGIICALPRDESVGRDGLCPPSCVPLERANDRAK